MVVLDLCDPETSGIECASWERTKKWIERKYFFVLNNQSHFVKHEFGQARMHNRSKLFWYPLSYRIKSDYVQLI